MKPPQFSHDDVRIAVVGLGHVGLPTALAFADAGWQVIGTDSAAEKMAALSEGRAPFYEPGVEEMLRRQMSSSRLSFEPSLAEAVRAAQVVFVCVSTPQAADGSLDLSYVESVSRAIAPAINGYKLIVEKSTTPVRTVDRIKQTIGRYANGEREFDVAVNPEFLQEGRALHDVLHPDRVVLGVESDRARDLLHAIYRPLLDRIPVKDCQICERSGVDTRPEDRLIVTDMATAELVKHSANAFLAMKISFVNMIADMCEATGADVMDVARGLGLDPRIGPSFLRAGVGYGGSCLPKDVKSFIRLAGEHRVDVSLLRIVADINDRRIDRLMEKLSTALWVMRGKTIGLLGLAFKPETDDVRDATSLKVVSRLLAEGCDLRLYDPRAMENFRQHHPAERRLVYCDSAYAAAAGAHALVVLTEWDEFRRLELDRIRAAMELPIIVDGRNIYDPALLRDHGFEYCSFGRP